MKGVNKMSTKQNMFVGATKNISQVNELLEDAVVMWKKEDNNRSIVAYDIEKALEIRDQVSELKGELKILIKGSDMDDTREKYLSSYKKCEEFLNITKQEFNAKCIKLKEI